MEIIPSKIVVRDNSIAIVGWDDGGAGQVQAWLEKSGKYHVACFVNESDEPINIDIEIERKKRACTQFDFPSRDSFKGRPLITSINWIDSIQRLGINKALIMTNDKRKRLENITNAKKNGLKLINAIHPSAIILDDAIIQENVVIYAKVIIGYRAEIFPGVVINTSTQIDHHNVVCNCVTIDPGVVTAGNVVIGECAHVHTGAIIKNKINIGENSIIGAGSVIIRDVPSNVTVVGVPGKIIKYNEF